jgi:cephalosporin hydroxylase
MVKTLTKVELGIIIAEQDGSISEFDIYHPLVVVGVYPVVIDIFVVQLSDPDACL